MNTTSQKKLHEIYQACRSIVGYETWEKVITGLIFPPDPEQLMISLERTGEQGIPEFLPDLARLEWTIKEIEEITYKSLKNSEGISINPSLRLLELSWKNLIGLINTKKDKSFNNPEPGKEIILLWKAPSNGRVNYRPASNNDMLALKMSAEKISADQVAEQGNVAVGLIDAVIDRAVREGILIAPPSQLNRDPSIFTKQEGIDEAFQCSKSFTLQWHITQACDLHCKHCYDRSNRPQMPIDRAIKILDDLRSFCRSRHVMGAISLTGGNPFLYPHLMDLYRAASERGFSLALLGNPTSREVLKELIAIQKPTHIQVSLEGLPEHNDYIRGKGHFERVMKFLQLLRELNIFSMVMLTLTKENMSQIIPLGEMLEGIVDRFHFNRLSMVGEGINLSLPERDEYKAFLNEYIEVAKKNSVLGFKDNMINILMHEKGQKPFGGCAGYGCGAAFNFLALLPDGEVHACRKLPSYLGNINHQSISEIYDSELASRYRSGCSSCRGCPIRAVCGGCLAVANSYGLDIFEEKDPFCFIRFSHSRQ
jgi:selenobiotic family peptide radical SAM maturase